MTEKKKKAPDSYDGIVLKDQELSSEFSSEPRIYGNAQVSEDELKVLNLPPEYGLYQKVNVQTMTIETERALNKLRWKRIIEKSDGTNEEKFLVTTERDGKKTLNINNLRCTELPFNPNVAMPSSITFNEEVKYHQFKEEVKTIAEKYKKKTGDQTNLTDDERNGLKTLTQKVKDNTIICYQTDKSGRWSCDTAENYKTACNKHLEDPTKTEVIELGEHERAEKELNCQGYALLRMAGLKDDINGERIRKAMKLTNNALAPFYSLRKDHKKMEVGKDCLTFISDFIFAI